MINQQTFELLILGCSSASPTSDRNPSGQLLNIAERFFLIDCGEATQIQLRRYKAKFQSIGHLFISHLHGDHFFGVPGLVSSMHLLGRQKPLHIYAPKALKELMDMVMGMSDTRLKFPVIWHFTGEPGLQLLFEDDKVEVHSFPLYHRIACHGFLFREKPLPRKIDKYKLERLKISFADILKLKAGMDVVNEDGELITNSEATLDPAPSRTYAYCSDTCFDLRVAEHVRGVDLLYHESTFLKDQEERAKATFHSTAAQAAEIAKIAGVKQLLLGHYSARYRELEGFEQEAGNVFPHVLLAKDGKKIKI